MSQVALFYTTHNNLYKTVYRKYPVKVFILYWCFGFQTKLPKCNNGLTKALTLKGQKKIMPAYVRIFSSAASIET